MMQAMVSSRCCGQSQQGALHAFDLFVCRLQALQMLSHTLAILLRSAEFWVAEYWHPPFL